MNHFIKTRTHCKIVGIKKERQQVFYLLSALETVLEIAVRSAILFFRRRHIAVTVLS